MADDGKPFGFWRALGNAEFWLLLVTALSGALGLMWWVSVPLCVAGISISSLPKYVTLWPRARETGSELEWWKTVGLSMMNALAASSAVFVFGMAARWFAG